MTAFFEFVQTFGLVFLTMLARFALMLLALGVVAVPVLLAAAAVRRLVVRRHARQSR